MCLLQLSLHLTVASSLKKMRKGVMKATYSMGASMYASHTRRSHESGSTTKKGCEGWWYCDGRQDNEPTWRMQQHK